MIEDTTPPFLGEVGVVFCVGALSHNNKTSIMSIRRLFKKNNTLKCYIKTQKIYILYNQHAQSMGKGQEGYILSSQCVATIISIQNIHLSFIKTDSSEKIIKQNGLIHIQMQKILLGPPHRENVVKFFLWDHKKKIEGATKKTCIEESVYVLYVYNTTVNITSLISFLHHFLVTMQLKPLGMGPNKRQVRFSLAKLFWFFEL